MPMSDADRRSRREQRILNGLCTACGKQPPEAAKRMCATCAGYYRTYNHKRLSKGLCRKCGRIPMPGKKQCARCLNRALAYREELRDLAFNAYGGYLCACCSETRKEFLQIDHTNNDGAEHRKHIGCVSIYNWLKANGFPSGFQILCANCNYAKAHYGYCPHQPHTEVNHAPRKHRGRHADQEGSAERST